MAQKLASTYHFSGDDPESVAMEALAKAWTRWDPEKGANFGWFAKQCIINSLNQVFDRNKRDDRTTKISYLEMRYDGTSVGADKWMQFAYSVDGQDALVDLECEDVMVDHTDAEDNFRLFMSLLDEREQAVVMLKLKGKKTPEIMKKLQCSQPTISRVLRDARVKFEIAFHEV